MFANDVTEGRMTDSRHAENPRSPFPDFFFLKPRFDVAATHILISALPRRMRPLDGATDESSSTRFGLEHGLTVSSSTVFCPRNARRGSI